MKIPFVDLKLQYQNLKPEIDKAIAQIVDETSFIGGSHVKKFEDAFAALYGVKHCISCGNGTDSLFILMKMMGIGSGDEVITAANSWISSSETITQTGARPVFVDVEERYYSLNASLLETVITSKTKAIIVVHLHGQMCDMDAIKEIANKHRLFLIEDCAQSHFSEFKGQRAGTSGNAGSFSFYPGKNLGAYGDAGCIITNDDVLAENCRMYARHGGLQKHEHKIEGINSRMDSLQAAILSVKLKYILQWTEQRIHHVDQYNTLLKGIEGLTTPALRPDTKHTYHLYVIRSRQRNALAGFLKEKGIETALHYPTPLPFLKAYEYLKHKPEDFPVAWEIKEEILSLPIYPELTEAQIKYVTDTIKEFYKTSYGKLVTSDKSEYLR